MALNNNCLYNAALAGALQGSMAGRTPLSSVASSYAGLVAACQALATEIDAQIAFDATITTSASNTILAVTTNTIQGNEIGKTKLMTSIVSGVVQGRILTDATAADYLTLAAAIAAVYTESLTVLVAP